MKLFIPACGDRLTLTKPWTFELWLERRNMRFAVDQKLAPKEQEREYAVYEGEPYRSPIKRVETTLPAGTVIECDRVYIRGYNKSRLEAGNDYDSVTWKVIDPVKGKAARNGRFWTKLSDCNGLDFKLEDDALFRDRVKVVRQVMES